MNSKKTKSKLYLITAVHNNLAHTKKLLKDIDSQTLKPAQIIVVDDGSTDGTSQFLNEKYPAVKIIKGNGNLWWTKSLFLAVEYVLKTAKDNDYILTINADCSFSKEYLKTIYQTGVANPQSIVGSIILDANIRNKIWDAGTEINWAELTFKSIPYKYINKIPRNQKNHSQSDALSTKGTLFSIKTFKQVGNFDYKRLPHYHSDYEYSCRAKRQGFKLLVDLKARVYTDTQQTGIGDNIPKDMNIREKLRLLLSRRSKLNLVDSMNFIRLCCPKQYRFKNYLRIIGKIVQNFF